MTSPILPKLHFNFNNIPAVFNIPLFSKYVDISFEDMQEPVAGLYEE